jgi:hypothetical protein
MEVLKMNAVILKPFHPDLPVTIKNVDLFDGKIIVRENAVFQNVQVVTIQK